MSAGGAGKRKMKGAEAAVALGLRGWAVAGA